MAGSDLNPKATIESQTTPLITTSIINGVLFLCHIEEMRNRPMKREDFDAYYAHAMPLDIPPERIEPLRALKCRFPLESIDKERTLSLREAAEDVGLFFELLRYSYAGYEFYRDKVDFPAVERQILDGLPAGGLTATISHGWRTAFRPYITDITTTKDSGRTTGDSGKWVSCSGTRRI